MKVDLSVEVGGLRLANPTMLASGVLGVSSGGLVRAWNGGAGAVVAKTVGVEPREGHPGPRLVGVRGGGLLNAMGLPSPGVEAYLAEVEEAIGEGALVVGSVAGSSPEEYGVVAERLAGVGVAALELNVSCPHAGGLYAVGMDPGRMASVVGEVVGRLERRGVPVWVKLPGTTDYPRLVEVARAAQEAGASAVVAINTLPALALDAEAMRPLLGAGIGGLSGPPIKPVALRAVWELYRAGLSIPIVGVGGILDGRDAAEFLLAGATAVQIGTGVLLRGPVIFRRVCQELASYLRSHGLSTPQQLVGLAHSQASEAGEPQEHRGAGDAGSVS